MPTTDEHTHGSTRPTGDKSMRHLDENRWCVRHMIFCVQLDRDQSFQRMKGNCELFVIDLSLNELAVMDVKVLVELVRAYNNVSVLVADNRFSWKELQTFLQSEFPLEGLR